MGQAGAVASRARPAEAVGAERAAMDTKSRAKDRQRKKKTKPSESGSCQRADGESDRMAPLAPEGGGGEGGCAGMGGQVGGAGSTLAGGGGRWVHMPS